jgi:FkbM family methyltransferase
MDNRMLKKILKTVLCPILGRKTLQPVLEKVHWFILAAMNFSIGEVSESGEAFVVRYVKTRLQNNPDSPVIFDVGANLGNWSLQCLEHFRQHVRLYIFEPSRYTFDRLTENLSATHGTLLGKMVFPFNMGLSDATQAAMLYYDKKLSGMASVYKRKLNHFAKSLNYEEKIEVMTLDDFCQRQDIGRIHFLKMDTEGHELNILKGAEKMIAASAIDFIQFEFGGCNIDSRTYFQDFFYYLTPKYRVYRVCKDGLRQISSYKEQYEVFVTANYLAERRNLAVD